MVVPFVQGIIGTLDEYLPPLNETGRQEAGDHADNDLLDKRRLHRYFRQQNECHYGAVYGVGTCITLGRRKDQIPMAKFQGKSRVGAMTLRR